MMLEESNSGSAIGWVREDLDECLENVRENLEAFAEDTSKREPLMAVQEELEQLNLTFLTMEQQGAGILTDEMIAVGGHMLHNGSANYEESLNALTDAVIVLPSYLDRLQAGHDDLPILLLPTLNELRATHDESLMSEGSLFAPELDIIIPELSGSEADAVASSDFAAFSRKIRSQYQGALLGWLQEQSRDALLDPMQAVCRTLYIRLGRNELRRLWWIAEMAMQGLRDSAIDNDLPLRRLFARLDLILKSMTEGGESGPPTETITALSRALLFYAAQARPGSKATDLLRKRFQLEELIPDREALLRARGAVTGRDAALFQSIGDAVREELTQVKDTLDMELRTGRVDAEQRAESKTSLQQLADTLEMLNLPVPAKAVEGLLPALEETDSVTNMDLDSPLLGLAQKLLEVEAILDTHIQLLGEPVETEQSSKLISLPPQELRHIFSQMLDECVSDLHEVQDAVRKRLDGDSEADFETSLARISGALAVSDQSEVAALTDKLIRVLNASMAATDGEVGNLEAITDAIAALELFLAACRDGQGGNYRLLEVMANRLEGQPEASASGDEVPATEIRLRSKPAPPVEKAEEIQTRPGAPDIDPAMLGIFLEEFDAVRRQLGENLDNWLANSADTKALSELRRGFHTLKGSGRMVGALEVGDFSWKFEELLNKLMESKISLTPVMGETFKLAVAALDDMRARLVGESSELDENGIKSLGTFARLLTGGNQPDLQNLHDGLPASLVSRATEAMTEAPVLEAGAIDEAAESTAPPESVDGDLDHGLQQVMMTEIREHVATLQDFVDGLLGGTSQPVESGLVRAAHTLAGTFAMAPVGQEAQVARALEKYLEDRQKTAVPASETTTVALQTCLHRFHQRLSVIEDGNTATYPLEDEQLLSVLFSLAEHEESVIAAPAGVDSEEEILADVPVTETVADDAGTPEPAAADDRIEIEEGSIISIFLEEAVEVLERCDTLLNTWRDKLSDRKLVQNLQREIHTFKGGARMAGLSGLGDLSHAMETLLEHIASNRVEATVACVQALEEGCDCLNIWVEQLQSGRLPQTGDALERFNKRVNTLHTPQTEDVPETIDSADILPAETLQPAAVVETQAPAETPTEAPAKPTGKKRKSARKAARKPALGKTPDREFREIQDRPAAAADDAAPGAQIRVGADLMDKLVNHAGEISIYRSRLEQQLGHVRHNLKDVDGTVQRLKEQLRKMDIESEAQMMSRYKKASGKDATEFDPLELDRFSHMQQLSRSLSESVSDLLNLHEMLDDSIRQAESLLTQQSRVSSDLQEGLMQTRMTPFGSAAPRLRRIVRAAAAETGKQARLQLRMAGSSDQLDRNVLERITAPLEHMLRNAIAHGIETPKQRRKAKKSEEGSITVTVEAEATEFVIRVEDDGGGVNLDAVRKRAIERGLMDKDDHFEPHQLIQFIRESGFSTSDTVTGLAGRGVGMDVVNSEIKQIGGAMDIETESGKGTRFTIRIPFSLAVMQAIAVNVGERPFQIPLNSVAGVSRMSPGEYSALLKSESPVCEFAGEDFPLLELEPLLGAPPLPLDSENVSLLMIRAGDRQAAFRVSGLQGHQEVVIKPVGPQVSSIPGILGGTIAADGQVMIILDMGPLIRRGMERAGEQPAEVEPQTQETSRQPLVMVVDDSITMRKVTSRVLDNHSIEVITAQDGVDAIEQLHDHVPDLMLLDIEMPRMDGYELLEHVRADSRLRHVPVVMITSRAGQKHRRKARKAGANAYLTKPYQEAELVEKVSEMLDIDLIPRRSD